MIRTLSPGAGAILPWLALLLSGCGSSTDEPDLKGPLNIDRIGVLPPPNYEIEYVKEGRIPELEGARDAVTNPVNGYTYVLDGEGMTVQYLTDAYIHPSGEFCLDSPEENDEDCSEGILWLGGRIELSVPATALCLDREEGRMFLVKEGRNRVEVADVAEEGETARTYNRTTGVFQIPEGLLAGGEVYDGPCEYVPSTDSLIVSSPDTGSIALFDLMSGEVRAISGARIAASGITLLDDRETVIADDPEGERFLLLSASDLSELGSLPSGGPIEDYGLDPSSGLLYVAHAEGGGVSVIDTLSRDPSAVRVEVEGDPFFAEADPNTGIGFIASRRETGVWVLELIQGGEVVSSRDLSGTVICLAPPSEVGDLAVFTTDESGTSFTIFDARPDRPPDLPPLYIFLVTTIEHPTDMEMDKPCTGGDSVEALVEQVEANGRSLAGLGIPAVVGIVYNFAQVTERCGRTDIFDTLSGLGLRLGYMVHNKPCYNCTDISVPGNGPDSCGEDDPSYCNPMTASCCFPDNEDYCGTGDWECYKAFIDERGVVLDRNIEGGGRFIFGADRHGMWDWDWVRGYREMARADGSSGYDLAMFAAAWAYSDEVEISDPRGKDPAPWRPADRVRAWAPLTYEYWEKDSAFSSLLYLPGLPIATIKLFEWHSSGLFLYDLYNTGMRTPYTWEDFEVLTQYLRKSLAYVSMYEPNTWYFHIHDISTVNLADVDGEETVGAAFLREWLEAIQERYVDTGYAEWKYPDDIRDEFPPLWE